MSKEQELLYLILTNQHRIMLALGALMRNDGGVYQGGGGMYHNTRLQEGAKAIEKLNLIRPSERIG